MNKKERELLLMVAKDLRRLWTRSPEMFGVMPGYSLYANRRTQYDTIIKELENGKEHEADSGRD